LVTKKSCLRKGSGSFRRGRGTEDGRWWGAGSQGKRVNLAISDQQSGALVPKTEKKGKKGKKASKRRNAP